MPAGLENVIELRTATQHKTLVNEKANHKADVNFEVFGAKEIRDVLKSRAHCIRAGFPANHIIIATLNEIRDHYIHRVGLPTYLSQMLGDMAKAPIQDCILYDHADQPIQLNLTGQANQPVQRFIARHFHWNNLPFRIEARKEQTSDPGQVRYL